jgi:hypothetical protein
MVYLAFVNVITIFRMAPFRALRGFRKLNSVLQFNYLDTISFLFNLDEPEIISTK